MERHVKHRRFPSQLSSEEETKETGEEFDISSFALAKPYRTICLQLSSFYSTGLDEIQVLMVRWRLAGNRNGPKHPRWLLSTSNGASKEKLLVKGM